jgi:hypothetical protein
MTATNASEDSIELGNNLKLGFPNIPFGGLKFTKL